MFASGIGLAIWARIHLGRNWGMPTSQKADPELVTTGPYRFVRHPIYTGLLVALLGTALAVGELRCFLGVVLAAKVLAYFDGLPLAAAEFDQPTPLQRYYFGPALRLHSSRSIDGF